MMTGPGGEMSVSAAMDEWLDGDRRGRDRWDRSGNGREQDHEKCGVQRMALRHECLSVTKMWPGQSSRLSVIIQFDDGSSRVRIE